MFGQSLELLDNIRLNFNAEGLFFLNITLAFVMFGVALELKLEKFKRVFFKPVRSIKIRNTSWSILILTPHVRACIISLTLPLSPHYFGKFIKWFGQY